MRAIIPFSRKQRFNLGFLAGLAAGIIASGLMLILNATVGGVSLPEAFGAFFTQITPLSVFQYLHETIGGDAKHYLFYGILVGQVLVFALSGGLCNLIVGSAKFGKMKDEQGLLHWLVGVILALALWLLTGLAFLPLTGAGIFGAALTIGIVNTMLSLAVVGLAFGFLFIYGQNWLVLRYVSKQEINVRRGSGNVRKSSSSESLPRRVVLERAIALLGLGTLGVIAWRFITGSSGAMSSNVSASQLAQGFKPKIVPPPVPNYGNVQQVPLLSTEITSNDQYYIVSKNLGPDPTVNSNSWSLTVDGQVEHPYTLTYDALTALPMKQQYESMMCISNEVGGEYMSNALWEGVPLADLLNRAGGVKPGSTKVVFYSVDDYSDSIHLTKALEPTTLVAVHMNGATLPTGHGFPARVLVPGIYGMKHAKWLKRIEVVNYDYQGYWQNRGWSDEAPIRLTSRIDTPGLGSTLPANKPSFVAGVAFSGNKGISQVDVSLDAGKTWQTATLKPPLSNLTWVLWELPWQPKSGQYTIVARAVDMEGNVQDPQVEPPLPDGSSGYHSIDITVQ